MNKAAITCGATAELAWKPRCLIVLPAFSGLQLPCHVMPSRKLRLFLRRSANQFLDGLQSRFHLQRPRFLLSAMAASEPSRYLARSLPRAFAPSAIPKSFCWRRNVSDQASSKASVEVNDLESAGSLTSAALSEDALKSFDPIARSRGRKKQLPRSRYVSPSPSCNLQTLSPGC